MLRGAAAVLLATPDAARAGAAGNEHLLPPGVDLARFGPSSPERARIVFAGKLERAKGVRELVRAFAHVRDQLPEAELVLAGDGPERGWIEEEGARLGLNGSMRLLGPVPHEAVPELLAGATVVCLPSYGEPYGMALVEAMAAGRPVVATAAGGPRFLLDPEQGGRLVPVGDSAALAAALAEVLSDPARAAAMGSFNRAKVEREFSLERALDSLEAIYAEVVA